MTSKARNLARLVVDNSGALAAANLANAPNPILPGTVAYLGMNTAPTGWLKANGALVSRSTFAALFAAIGTTYGAGDGSTTFALPDLRGEFPRGWDDGRGVDSGRAFGSFQVGTRIGHMASFGGDLNAIEGNDATVNASRCKFEQNNTRCTTRSDIFPRPRNVALLACIKF